MMVNSVAEGGGARVCKASVQLDAALQRALGASEIACRGGFDVTRDCCGSEGLPHP
jgi:hypothetical protein